MTRTKDVVSLNERKKERKVRGFPKSGEKEEQGGEGGGEKGSLPRAHPWSWKKDLREFSARASLVGRTVHKLFPYLDLTTCENCENKKLFVREKKPVVYSEVKTKKNTTHHLVKSIWNWTCRGSELKKLMIGHKKNRLLAMTITRNCYWQKRGKILGMNCHAWFKLFHKKLNSW